MHFCWHHLSPFTLSLSSKRKLSISDAGAVAAANGSVSAVTFVAAASFLEAQKIPFDGPMVAVMALMESPAIVVGVILIMQFDKR